MAHFLAPDYRGKGTKKFGVFKKCSITHIFTTKSPPNNSIVLGRLRF